MQIHTEADLPDGSNFGYRQGWGKNTLILKAVVLFLIASLSPTPGRDGDGCMQQGDYSVKTQLAR